MTQKFIADNDYSDAENLAIAKEALAQVMKCGVAYSMSGRQWTSADLPELRETITWLESRIGGDSAPATNLMKPMRR